jgi:isopenicillin N synthase-like dioxygenase
VDWSTPTINSETDFGSITLLWSQPVSALQILEPDGRWTWVRHVPNAIVSVICVDYSGVFIKFSAQVINAGDMLEFLCGGYYKAAIHRVVQPPSDQIGYTRLGAFYFVIPDDEKQLVPFDNSPVLKRHGTKKYFENEEAPFVEQWRRARTSAYGQSELKKAEEKLEVEVIHGAVVKHWS